MSKIIVAGDSIAYGKWDSMGGWVARLRKYIDEAYNLHNGGNFQVYNLSIPGEVVPRIAERFEAELLMRLPYTETTNGKTLVILAVGINDSCPNNWMTLQQTPELTFKDGFRTIIQVAQKNNCKVVVLGLTPTNASKSKGLLFSDEEVKKYDMYLTEVCGMLHIPKLQLFEILTDQAFPELLIDVVHPNDNGHEVLFQLIKTFLESKNLFQYLTS